MAEPGVMSLLRRKWIGLFGALVGGFAASGYAPAAGAAENYPSRPIRLLVGFAPGGGNDTLARFIAQRLQESLKQTVLVENRPGASGVLAVEAVRQAPADGYTLLVAPSSSMTVNPVVMRNLTYDPKRDLAAVSLLGRFPLALVVHPSVPARTVRELISSARERPGQLAYAAASTSYQLATEMLSQAAGVSLLHVPYKGSAPAIQAVVSNEVPMALADVATVVPFVRSGHLRVLGVSTAAPTRTMPDVPPIATQGIPGFDIAVWAGLFAPAKTERAVIERLQAEVSRISRLPDVQERLVALGIEPASSTADELSALIVEEIDTYTRIARLAGVERQ
jgi:tripartite-type tricarboxylate transporter receptor subunit TctC